MVSITKIFNKINIYLLIILLLSAISCLIIYQNELINRGPPKWDEATHFMFGVRIYQDIVRGKFIFFLEDTFRQDLWPFVYSWQLALFFLITGDCSITSARILSLILFFFSSLVLYALGKEVTKDDDRLAGAITSFLFLISPLPMLFSVEAMLEMPGLLASSLALLAYIKAKENNKGLYLLTGFLVAAVFLIKYNFGLHLIIMLIIMFLVDTRLKLKRILLEDNPYSYLFLPLIGILIIWFAFPSFKSKIYPFLLLSESTTYYPASEFYTWKGFIYYPISLFKDYSSSVFIFAITIISFILSFREWRNRQVKILLIFFISGFLSLMILSIKQGKFLITIMPALWVLTSNQVTKAISKVARSRSMKWGLAILSLVLIVPGILNLYGGRPTDSDEDIDVYRALDFISEQIDPTQFTMILGESNDISPDLVDWWMVKKTGLFHRDLRLIRPYRPPSSSTYERELDRILKAIEIPYIVAIEMKSAVRRDSWEKWDEKIVGWRAAYIEPLQKRDDYHLSAAREFTNPEMTIKIYSNSKVFGEEVKDK